MEELLAARHLVAEGNRTTAFAQNELDIALRRHWEKATNQYFEDHPEISEFTWKQYSEKTGEFHTATDRVEIDGIDYFTEGSNNIAYKDAVELLDCFKAPELKILFGNFVEVTVRRDCLTYLQMYDPE